MRILLLDQHHFPLVCCLLFLLVAKCCQVITAISVFFFDCAVSPKIVNNTCVSFNYAAFIKTRVMLFVNNGGELYSILVVLVNTVRLGSKHVNQVLRFIYYISCSVITRVCFSNRVYYSLILFSMLN